MKFSLKAIEMPMKKRKIPSFEGLTEQQYKEFTDGLKKELEQLEEDNKAQQIDLAEYSLRKAYLDKIKDQNTLFSGGKNLL